jgi:lysophospholipid acyltransferase (LPLAT)-like uncharacterized protein
MQLHLKEKTPFILAHWHGDELVLFWTIPRYRLATIASTSKDGEIMNSLIYLQKGVTSRGSSTRGGATALKGLIRLVQKGRNCSFAVDGPKGPIHKVKPGIFELSRLLKAPIYYSGVSCDRVWRFEKSWNKTYVPKPFAQVFIEWFGPLPAVGRDQDPRSDQLANNLEEALHNARALSLKKIATTQG